MNASHDTIGAVLLDAVLTIDRFVRRGGCPEPYLAELADLQKSMLAIQNKIDRHPKSTVDCDDPEIVDPEASKRI